MTGVLHWLRTRVFPPVPEAIRDDISLLRATRIESQTPLMFAMLLATTPTAAYAGAASVHPAIRLGFPLILVIFCIMGIMTVRNNRKRVMSVRRSRRVVTEAIWVSGAGAILCSSWCVVNWFASPPEHHSYFAMILAMGSLATAYCLASIRLATFVNLTIGVWPIAILMLTSGNPPEIAAAVSLIAATSILLRMIMQQHGQLVDLLLLQRLMRELADTDPLTGLWNRRALDARLDEEIAGAKPESRFAIALIDLDGFKPVNDSFGHAVGDELLCQVGARLKKACGDHALVARQGGDEFAILVPAGSPLLDTSLADHILAALAAPYTIDGHPISVGASIGIAFWPTDGANSRQLFETADRALYSAKAVDRPQTPLVEAGHRAA